MTEREYVIRLLARDAELHPELTGDALVGYLKERHGAGWHGGSGWLPHVPRDPEQFRDPETGLVRAEWLRAEHTWRFSCRLRGVWLGEWCHRQKGTPDITWQEVAAYAQRNRQPRQLSIWEVAA